MPKLSIALTLTVLAGCADLTMPYSSGTPSPSPVIAAAEPSHPEAAEVALLPSEPAAPRVMALSARGAAEARAAQAHAAQLK